MARILIVDDSLLARKTLRKIILALGHSVAGEAINGLEAVTEYAKLKPDAVTMDLTMPGSDGDQATSEIIAAFPDARIIVVSARQDLRIIIDALERGARHFIVKPISMDKVKLVLDNVLQQTFDSRQQQELIARLKQAAEMPKNKDTGLTQQAAPRAARVLIVDDSAVARQCLRNIVTELGHNVIGEAGNGSQAFVEYMKLKPDVVTMDLTMQGLGGAEATSKIIAANSAAKIIIISAMEAREGIIDALERGARHFIVKPIQKATVAAVLDNVLQQDFNLAKHRAQVRKLQAINDSRSLLDKSANKLLPPYHIMIQGNHLVQVCINQSITAHSFETLFVELAEHLADHPRILLDFGTVSHLDESMIFQLNELITTVENDSGMVKAISNNKRFIEFIEGLSYENGANLLADTLRYIEN